MALEDKRRELRNSIRQRCSLIVCEAGETACLITTVFDCTLTCIGKAPEGREMDPALMIQMNY